MNIPVEINNLLNRLKALEVQVSDLVQRLSFDIDVEVEADAEVEACPEDPDDCDGSCGCNDPEVGEAINLAADEHC